MLLDEYRAWGLKGQQEGTTSIGQREAGRLGHWRCCEAQVRCGLVCEEPEAHFMDSAMPRCEDAGENWNSCFCFLLSGLRADTKSRGKSDMNQPLTVLYILLSFLKLFPTHF